MNPSLKPLSKIPSIAAAIVAVVLAAPLAAAPAGRTTSPAYEPKPSAPLEIEHEISGSALVGLPVELTLRITAGRASSGTVVMLFSEDPLALIEPPAEVTLGSMDAGEAAEIAVTVLPLTDKTHYLSVTVRGAIDGTLQSRSVSVPIRLETSRAAPDARSDSPKDASRVRSLTALELIR